MGMVRDPATGSSPTAPAAEAPADAATHSASLPNHLRVRPVRRSRTARQGQLDVLVGHALRAGPLRLTHAKEG
ncbi:hypothetical protein Spla01_06188 [Streptomyces platensis]|uniref:Uncharacterized protein n=1 Tax=Streptomyces platensis TaxID=58346 RepID=A0ABX3Y6E2_STRPT|nr:hypothetical protein BG653_00334 [Streptomyces platensis]